MTEYKRGVNKYLGKSFKKYYTGKSGMASLEEISNNLKYQDKKNIGCSNR